jgi:hypothetical protein
MGGSVSGGNAYMVGERGPELFVPKVPGTIIPNRGTGSGSNVVVNAPLTVGDGVDRAHLRLALDEHARMIKKTIVPIVYDANRRNKLPLH